MWRICFSMGIVVIAASCCPCKSTARNDEDARDRRALSARIPVNFDGNRLENVIGYIRNASGQGFYVNWADIQNAGVERDMPITIAPRKSMAIAQLLDEVLAQASGELGWTTYGGIITVGRRQSLPRRVPSRRVRTNGNEKNREVARAMEKAVPINFEENRLEGVMRYLGQATGQTVTVDWNGLQQVGIERDTTISLSLKTVPVAQVIDLILERKSTEQSEIRVVWSIRDGAVVIHSQRK